MPTLYHLLPSADACLCAMKKKFPDIPHGVLLEHCRSFLDGLRSSIRTGVLCSPGELDPDNLMVALETKIRLGEKPRLRRVINAAGVVVHTNLGRSVLAREAQEAVRIAAQGYCNLEYDLATGERGSRISLVEDLLCSLTGAEAALVVNNNAAAVLLMLDTLCKGGEAILSRGQLVEIGGSFRIPDVMERSGTVLREVGTTNRTHLSDYEKAVSENTRAILWVHPSNYRIIGFHAAPEPSELSRFAHSRGFPFLEDLGSGSQLDFSVYGLHGEPTVAETLRSGADVVTFSGDKVLGGPQAGIIVGKKEFIGQMKRNQLLRALRCGKLTLAALEATLRLYRDEKTARRSIPTVRRLSMRYEDLLQRARTLLTLLSAELEGLADCCLKDDFSRVGGGAYPEQGMPTALVCIAPRTCTAEDLRTRLLAGDPPLVGRMDGDAFALDVRTLENDDFNDASRVLKHALELSR